MSKICYTKKRFSTHSLEVIATANQIIEEYELQGFSLTLRQIYYQFVSRDLIPNNIREYKKLGTVINNGRLAGLIDWEAIIDRTRNLQRNSHWENPREIIETCAKAFRIDKWKNQDFRPEVWIEKDALVGVIEGICRKLDIPYFSCRGYTSQSEMWSASQRLQSYFDQEQPAIIIHLGDHDPSGIDMTRDIQDRMELFMGGTQVKRIALNADQVEEFNPPPNPSKVTDPRAKAYIIEFGYTCWELDALEPKIITNLIEKTVLSYRDDEKWAEMVALELEHRETLGEVADNFGNKPMNGG